MDPSRRSILAAGAAATALAAAQRVFGRQTGQGGTDIPFYERGPVRIYYEEAGSGFPLLLIPGGGLNSTFSGLARGPFNPIEEFEGGPVNRHGTQVSKETWVTVGTSGEVTDAVRGDPCRG